MSEHARLMSGIVQIGMGAHDPARLVAFYRDVLRLPVLFETAGMTFFDAGRNRLMIGPQPPNHPTGGDTILYFEPLDWSQAENALARAGVEFTHRTEVLQRAGGKELVLRPFKDPEGHQLALLGWRQSAMP
jgi:catechol 2,3-dioxygenase-like lactoylglutathione lyase family enzyme